MKLFVSLIISPIKVPPFLLLVIAPLWIPITKFIFSLFNIIGHPEAPGFVSILWSNSKPSIPIISPLAKEAFLPWGYSIENTLALSYILYPYWLYLLS